MTMLVDPETGERQLTFADYRASDPDTSVNAAVTNRPKRSAHKQAVLDALRAAGPNGLTDFQIAEATGIIATSAGKRRLDLLRDGLVRQLVGVTRPSPTSTPAKVWVAA